MENSRRKENKTPLKQHRLRAGNAFLRLPSMNLPQKALTLPTSTLSLAPPV